MSTTRKPWGQSTALAREPLVHADQIRVAAGGFCSIHCHSRKANVFHVLSGMLVVRQFSAHGACPYSRAIGPGESRTVPAGIWHQFWCPGETLAVEVYLPALDGAELIADDIERHPECMVGGRTADAYRLDEQWSKAFGPILAGTR